MGILGSCTPNMIRADPLVIKNEVRDWETRRVLTLILAKFASQESTATDANQRHTAIKLHRTQ
jgi:hypothetical protein